MANLYMDEDMANFAPGLREAGHTVQVGGEAGPGRTDTWHLVQAGRLGRVLLTFNDRDYRFLHRLWTSLRIFGLFSRRHGGILCATAQLEPNVWIPELNALFDSEQPIEGRMLTWHEAQQEWREDKWRPES